MDNLELLQKTVLFKGSTREELDLVIGLFQDRQIKAEHDHLYGKDARRIALYHQKGQHKDLGHGGRGRGKIAAPARSRRFFRGARASAGRKQDGVSPGGNSGGTALLTRKDFQALTDLDPRTGARVLTAIGKLLAMRVKAYSALFRDMLLG